MNRISLRLFTGFLIVSGFLFVPQPIASAQVSIGVSPSIVELASAPGGSGEQSLQISNQGEMPVQVTVEVVSFPDLADEYSAVEWIELAASDLEILPESQTALDFTVAIPDDAATGGSYAQILITTGAGEGAQIGGQLAVGVLFEVDGDGDFRRELATTRFAPTLEPDGRVGFRGEIENTGNTLAFLTGQMEFFEAGSNEPMASLLIQTTRLLPSITSNVASEGSLPLPVGSELTSRARIYPGDPAEIDGLEPIEIESEFTVDPQLVVDATICENLDRGPTVMLDLGNPGSIGLVPQVSMVLAMTDGSVVSSIIPQNANVAWPGEDTSTPIEGLPQLAGGDYLLTVSALIVQGIDPLITEVPFSIGGFGDNVAPLCGSEPESTPDE